MATTKKAPAKKSAASSKATAPRTKKPTARKQAAKPAAAPARRHMFAISIVPDDQPFMTFRITKQTIYWFILGVAIIGLIMWVMNLNMQVMALYDQIDQNNTLSSQTFPVKKAVK